MDSCICSEGIRFLEPSCSGAGQVAEEELSDAESEVFAVRLDARFAGRAQLAEKLADSSSKRAGTTSATDVT